MSAFTAGSNAIRVLNWDSQSGEAPRIATWPRSQARLQFDQDFSLCPVMKEFPLKSFCILNTPYVDMTCYEPKS